MTEHEITSWIARRSGRVRGARVGIGDDAAVFRPDPREELVFTSDLSIEGRHFRHTDAPRHAGSKAMVRSLSDLAAMGAEPRFALISLAAPEQRLRDFYRGLLEWKVPVLGGDLSASDRIICDVTLCGGVPKGKALTRSGAKPGDIIYVSGPLGGFAARQYHIPPVPEPRLALGLKLRGRASACIDISDGISLDLWRLALASGVAADVHDVPVAAGATIEDALDGGEDYELLYTGPKGLPGIPIGVIRAGRAGDTPFAPRGYDHFAYNSQR